MWQNIVVLVIVAAAMSYVVWNIYSGIVSAAGSCGGGGGCGSCGSKSAASGNLVQLTSQPNDDPPASPADDSTVSSRQA